MNMTIWVTIAAAIFSAVAYLATKHAALFLSRFSTPLLFANLALMSLATAYRGGLATSYSTLLKFVDRVKFDEAIAAHDAVSDIPVNLNWFCVAFMVFLFILRFVAVHIANDELDQKSGEAGP